MNEDAHLVKIEPLGATTSEEEAIRFVFPHVNDTPVQQACHHHWDKCQGMDKLNEKILAWIDGSVTRCTV